MRNSLAAIKRLRLVDLLTDSPAFDPLAEAVYDLNLEVEKVCSLGEFMGFCRNLGLDLAGLRGAMLDSAEALFDQEPKQKPAGF